MNYLADSVEYWSQDGAETVFFGNEEKELALTISNNYFEWNDQSNACANAVKSLRLAGHTLRIQLLAKASRQLGTDAQLQIELVCGEDVLREVAERLRLIFGEKFKLTKPLAAAPAPPKDYSKIRYLNLEGKNLKTLPPHVRELTALQTARLGRNPKLDFREVCEVLSKFDGLKELSFTTDQPIPDNISKLRNLEHLSLSGFTTPQTLPESFGNLTKLRRLLIMSDSEVVLPESFAELTSLEALNIRAASWLAPTQFHKLSRLTSLDFGHCRFREVPEGLAHMESVTTAYFAGQSAKDYSKILPIVARMPNLKTLQLSAQGPLPEEVALCQQIEELVVWGATEIPASIGNMKGLQKLVLSLCDFETLPDSIGELSSLTALTITENPSLRTIPESLGRITHLVLEENPNLLFAKQEPRPVL